IGISRPLNRVVTGTTVIIMTVMDQTGEVVVTTTAATTTLETTTGIPADKKPGASGRVFAITEDHATKTS
nr:hypothetical protein [Tanacetum cinerariifolium]